MAAALRGMLAIISFVLAGQAGAVATLQVNSSGELVGALNVEVNATLYNVEIVEGSCTGLFSGCDEPRDFTFDTALEAFRAGLALFGQVFANGPQGNFDTEPALVLGCESVVGLPNLCAALTPYAALSEGALAMSVRISVADNSALEVGDILSDSFTSRDLNTASSGAAAVLVYARWTPAATSLPEPSCFTLLALGVLALGWSRLKTRTE